MIVPGVNMLRTVTRQPFSVRSLTGTDDKTFRPAELFMSSYPPEMGAFPGS